MTSSIERMQRFASGGAITSSRLRTLLCAVVTAMPTLSVAAGSEPSPATVQAEEMARQLRARYPSSRIDSVTPSVVPGLFEVVMGKNVAYVEPGGRYFLFGHVWDMQQQRDTTADRRGALDRVDVSALPIEHAIKTQYGSGTHVLHVLADPQCGYCKRLEGTLTELKDTTVYTYVLPILGPRSRQLAESIHCEAQPAKAWQAWMRQGVEPPPPPADCDPSASVTAIERAAASLGVQVTPTLIAGDGRKRSGALRLEDLLAWLKASPPVASSSGRANAGPGGVPITRKTEPDAVAADAAPRKANP